MRAGFGRWEVTPPMGVELAGYGYYLGRCAETVRDPLYARALLLEEGALRALIISCDLLGLSREVCADVFKHAKKFGVDEENVLIVSIHTHTGPCIKYHEGCGYPSDDFVATVAPNICRAIDAAYDDMDEVDTLEYVRLPFEGRHIYNRTIENGPVDRFVRGFTFMRQNRPAIAAVSAACHGVFRGRIPEVSADFAGEICRLIDASGMHTIYLNGLCGDIDPTEKGSDALLESFARLVRDKFLSDKKMLPITLSGASIPFTLKLTPVTMDDIHAAAAQAVDRSGGKNMPAARVALTWEREMEEKFASLCEEESITVKYLLLGGILIMALPFEGFTQNGLEIRSIAGQEDV